jgi:phenylalanine-4-hydroxylase
LEWSFEFGIIKSEKQVQIFGGAIVTSQNEINSVIKNIDRLKHITLDVIQRGISYTQNQKNYYYVSHFNEYEKLLNAI